ncbi:MAG TPA: CBS domain-containing protein [Kofleriaceae bacterium]|nr:CBS domain-containing protein [Kofleriaceae bacterium]
MANEPTTRNAPVRIRVRGVTLDQLPASSDRFEGIREVRAPVIAVPGVGGDGRRLLLEAARLRCRKGDPIHDGVECLACDRFVNYVPSPTGDEVTIRCRWCDDDPVVDVMTPVFAVTFVKPSLAAKAAGEVAGANQIHHLLVVEDDLLVGIVCQCDLDAAGVGELVGDRMVDALWITQPRATLADAAMAMKENHVGCLPVVDGEELVGVITRTDLLRAGVDQDRLV